jgi:hypothetical protein
MLSNHLNETGQRLAGVEVYPFASRISIGQAPVAFALDPDQTNARRERRFGIFVACAELEFNFRGNRLPQRIPVSQH